MANQIAITPSDFFSDPAAREAGFTEHFWQRAYTLYLEAANQDPSPSLEKFDLPRTVRMPFKQGHVDVMIRVHPESREFRTVRFTVFPADNEPEVAQVERWYFYDGESRPVLGEGALLNEGRRW